jgi:uncharacterized damage-inducible protein DinB
MRITSFAVAVAVACGFVSLSAQTRAGSGNPISTSIRSQWDGVKKNMTQSADIMSEADYAFRPVDSVRTFGQFVAHVAGANYLFCAASKGEKAPHAEDEFEKSAKTKADIVKALHDSLAYCDGQYTALDDASGAELVAMPFGMPKTARAGVLMMNVGHLNEHYGNLVTYFRIKGIVPPSSRPSK